MLTTGQTAQQSDAPVFKDFDEFSKWTTADKSGEPEKPAKALGSVSLRQLLSPSHKFPILDRQVSLTLPTPADVGARSTRARRGIPIGARSPRAPWDRCASPRQP